MIKIWSGSEEKVIRSINHPLHTGVKFTSSRQSNINSNYFTDLKKLEAFLFSFFVFKKLKLFSETLDVFRKKGNVNSSYENQQKLNTPTNLDRITKSAPTYNNFSSEEILNSASSYFKTKKEIESNFSAGHFLKERYNAVLKYTGLLQKLFLYIYCFFYEKGLKKKI
jgi:hypothetical protein